LWNLGIWDLGILQEFCVCGLGNFCGLKNFVEIWEFGIFFVDLGTVCLGFRLWVLSSLQFTGFGFGKLEIGNFEKAHD
jgi:hypothetical protein